MFRAIYGFMLGKKEQAFRDLEKGDEFADQVGNELRKASLNFVRSCIYYNLGNFDLSKEYIQKVFDVTFSYSPESKADKAWHNFFIWLTDVRAGRVESAKSKLETMMSYVSEFNPFLTYVATVRSNWLQAKIWIAEGLPDKAIELLECYEPGTVPTLEVDFTGPNNIPMIRDTLARAYLKREDIDGAIAIYEKKITFDPQNKERRLIHPKYHYLLGKLYEEKGDVAKAIEQYEKFLDVWKDADPGLPEVEDAKKRLALLAKN